MYVYFLIKIIFTINRNKNIIYTNNYMRTGTQINNKNKITSYCRCGCFYNAQKYSTENL